MDVTVYTTPTCPYCRMAKDYLTQRGVAYVERDVAADPAAAAEAVRIMARLLREKHGDGWMEDLLSAKPDERYWEATAHLAAARRNNLAEQPGPALEEARQAQRIYRDAGIRAGEVWGKYEEVYALYRSMELKRCLTLAGPLAGETATFHYGWILGQALMEEGNCRGLGGEGLAKQRNNVFCPLVIPHPNPLPVGEGTRSRFPFHPKL